MSLTVETSYYIPGNYEDPPETVIVDSEEFDNPQEAYECWHRLKEQDDNDGAYGLTFIILDENDDELSIQDVLERCFVG